MATIEERIAAHPVAGVTWNWVSFRNAARGYGPPGEAAVRAAEAALVAALDADDQRAETLRLEAEALQAAARLHREQAARFRDVIGAVHVALGEMAGVLSEGDVGPATVEQLARWVRGQRDDLTRALEE